LVGCIVVQQRSRVEEEAVQAPAEGEATPAAAVENGENGFVDAKASTGPKPRVVRLAKPDKAGFENKLQKLQDNLDRYSARINEIKALIERKRESRKAVSAGSSMTKSRMAELNAAFKARMDERNAVRDELLAADAARERLREEARSMRDGLSYTRIEDIDAEIQRLEGSIAHTTMALAEEKKLMTRIKDLSKSRDIVKSYHEHNAKISEEEGYRKVIIDRIRAKDMEIDTIKAEQVELRRMLEGFRAKEDAETADIPSLQAERSKCFELIKEFRETMRASRVEFKGLEDEYYQREREYRAQQREEQKRAYQEREAERKRRAEYRKKMEEENAVDPFTDEIVMCEQLVAYLSKWSQPMNGTTQEEKAVEEASNGVQGLTLIGKKKSDEEVFFVGGKGKKNKKGKGSAEAKKPERLIHGMDSLASFQKVGLVPPQTTADVAASVEDLKKAKEKFEELQKTKKAEKAARKAAEEAAAANGDAPTEKPPVTVSLLASTDSITVTLDVL